MRKPRFILWILIVLLHLSGSATAQQDTVRIATYNILNFPSALGSQRLDDFRIVVRAIDPDILVVQELESATGMRTFLDQVMNAQGARYSAGPFLNGFDTDSGIFYDPAKVTLVSSTTIRTTLRDIHVFKLEHAGIPFTIYSVHLKAGQDPSNEAERGSQAGTLRSRLNALPPGSNFIALGDFNIYNTSEPAFNQLTGDQADNDGRLFDPLNIRGPWHNNGTPVMAKLHTQSTRTTSLPDGGSTGGLDDRFDLILVSQSLLDTTEMWILKSSYTAFGNDGRHFNVSINWNRNFAVPDSVADALYYASDHLPVYADFVFEKTTAVPEAGNAPPQDFALQPVFPNPFRLAAHTVLTLTRRSEVSVVLYDSRGRQVAEVFRGALPAGKHDLRLDAARLPAGIYFLEARIGRQRQMTKVVRLK